MCMTQFLKHLQVMEKTIEFHNTPNLVRAYVENWLAHARKDKEVGPDKVAVLEDVLQLIDVALGVLAPVAKSESDGKGV